MSKSRGRGESAGLTWLLDATWPALFWSQNNDWSGDGLEYGCLVFDWREEDVIS